MIALARRTHDTPRRVNGRGRRAAFTLVELLTVIGIIALLIGILIPSLSRARAQAKKVKVAAMLDTVGKSLEMFHNDFGDYPASNAYIGNNPRVDPIDWSGSPSALPSAQLTGAHWLARALLGHDFLGVDTGQKMLEQVQGGPLYSVDLFDGQTSPPGVFSQRKGTYIEGQIFALDSDTQVFGNALAPEAPQTKRPVLYDAFEFPILYYKANPRAQFPMEYTGTAGKYVLSDNGPITGMDDGSTDAVGWDFGLAGVTGAGSPTAHCIGQFGDPDPADADLPADDCRTGKTFVGYLHNEGSHSVAGVVQPFNADRFVLISAGEDGIYGTNDDVNNFNSGS